MGFSSSIPSYLLKVTKFLGKISQFEFLVMTKKNIFAYKLFLSLSISDFNLCDNCTPPLPSEKNHPLFPYNSPLKVEVLSSPSFLKFGLRLNHPSPLQKGGWCTLCNFNFNCGCYHEFCLAVTHNLFLTYRVRPFYWKISSWNLF